MGSRRMSQSRRSRDIAERFPVEFDRFSAGSSPRIAAKAGAVAPGSLAPTSCMQKFDEQDVNGRDPRLRG